MGCSPSVPHFGQRTTEFFTSDLDVQRLDLQPRVYAHAGIVNS